MLYCIIWYIITTHSYIVQLSECRVVPNQSSVNDTSQTGSWNVKMYEMSHLPG